MISNYSVQAASTKERRQQLYQYGFEIRYMSMFRSIQASSKFVSTKLWLHAREELLFSKTFDRMTELRSQSNWSGLQMKAQDEPKRPKTAWDWLLEGVRVLAVDFKEESKWKRQIAKELAYEAAMVVHEKSKFRSMYGMTIGYTFEDRPIIQMVSEQKVPIIGFPGATVQLPLKRKLSPTQEDTLILKSHLTALDSEVEDTTEWSIVEDQFLLDNCVELAFAWNIISSAINAAFYRSRPIRTASACHARFLAIKDRSVESDIASAIAKRHMERIALMKAANTRIVSAKSLVNKKLSLNSHPSHDAAARKANLSISKILSPSELAMRRMQRQNPPIMGTPLPVPPSVQGSPGKPRPPMAPGQIPPGSIRKPSSLSSGTIGGPMYRPTVNPGASPLPMPPTGGQQPQTQQRMSQQYPPGMMMQRPPMTGMTRQHMLMLLQQQQQQQQQSQQPPGPPPGPNGPPNADPKK